MRQKKLPVLFIVLSFVVPVLYGQEAPSLGEIARQNRAQQAQQKDKGTKAAPPVVSPASSAPGSSATLTDSAPGNSYPTVTQPAAAPAAVAAAVAEPKAKLDAAHNLRFLEDYEDGIRVYFDHEEFEKLEQIADNARSTHAHFPGGYGTLHIIYVPLTQPVRGINASEDEWTIHLSRVKRWVSQRPKSITARVALAGAYLQYGWTARGGGYANEVTDGGWKLFAERADLASQTLIDAFSLPTKDPEWYLTMQLVARAQSQSKEMQAAIFEKAAAFDPDYHYYYRTEAESLLPKWDGEEGEMARFAESVADRLGGKKGDIVYYQIATALNCSCDNDKQLNGMSWPRIKRGYAAVAEMYGESLTTMNQISYMAAMGGDVVYAYDFFHRIGEGWDEKTWRTRAYFDQVREWVSFTKLTKDVEAASKAVDVNRQTPEGRKFDEEIARTFAANYGDVLDTCMKSTGTTFLIPFDFLMQIGKNGAIERAYVSVIHETSMCLGDHVYKGIFPTPPGPSYWVKVRLQSPK